MVNLDYRDSRPIYLQISDKLRERIAAGVLAPGDRLPSVRELAVELSINPNTIQRSYRQLEMEGYIATVAGKGCFVCGKPNGSPEEERELFKTFDKCVRRLLELGIPMQELAARLEQEENHA